MSFNVSKELLQMCYSSTVSVMTFGSASWGGIAAKQDRDSVEKVIKKAGREKARSFDSAYHRRVTDRLITILADVTHPLRPEFDNRRIGRSVGFRIPRTRTARYKNYFIQIAIPEILT